MTVDQPATTTTAAGSQPSIRWDDFRALWDRAGDERRVARRGRTDMAAAVLWLGALFAVFVTWNGAAERTSVGEQVPYLVSGGLASIAFALAGSAVFLLGVLGTARQAATPEEAEEDR